MGSCRALTLLAALALAACGNAFSASGGGGAGGATGEGGGGTTSSASSASAGGNGGQASGACSVDEVCVPEQWTSVARFAASQKNVVPGCTAEMATEVAFAMAAPVQGSIECPCNCFNGDSVICEGGQASYGPNCATTVGNVSEVCTTSNIGAIHFQTLPAATAGTCMASAGTPTKPELQWASYIRLCGSAAPVDSCSGGACAATQNADGVPLCVVRSGQHECPAPFNNELVAFTNVNDNRSCSACGCDADCGASYVQLYGATACSALPTTAVSHGACQPATAVSAKLVGVGGCAKTGGQPLINIVPTEPVTICCAGN